MVGISASTVDMAAEHIMKLSSTILLFFPSMGVMYKDILYPSPQSMNALAMIPEDSIKKMVVIPKFCITTFVVCMPARPGINSSKQDAIPIGMNSVTQVMMAHTIRTMALHPSTLNPSGGVILLQTT